MNPVGIRKKQICEILRAKKIHGTFRRTQLLGVLRMILLVCLQLHSIQDAVNHQCFKGTRMENKTSPPPPFKLTSTMSPEKIDTLRMLIQAVV